MTEPTVTEALDMGDDLLVVRGELDGEPVEATGWVSAMEYHYDPGCYDDDGNLLSGSEPRAMTADERLAYCRALLRDAEKPADEPKDLGIAG